MFTLVSATKQIGALLSKFRYRTGDLTEHVPSEYSYFSLISWCFENVVIFNS
jgi:hypothetical protein